MKKKLLGFIKLTRLNEHIGNDIIVPSLAIFVSRSTLSVNSLIAITANILAISFAFMINDIEDSEDDKKDKFKAKRNPVSAGLISKRGGYLFSILFAFISLACYMLIGLNAFILGLILLTLASLYSLKAVRFKKYPFIDILSHGLFHGVFPFVISYLSGSSSFSIAAITMTVSFFCTSIASDLRNEVRDFDVDRLASLRNTASIIGIKKTKHLILYLRITASTLITFFVFSRFDIESILLSAIYLLLLALVFTIFRKARKYMIPNIKEGSEVVLIILSLGLITLTTFRSFSLLQNFFY